MPRALWRGLSEVCLYLMLRSAGRLQTPNSCPASPREAMLSTSMPMEHRPQITAQLQLQLLTQAGPACAIIWQCSHGCWFGAFSACLLGAVLVDHKVGYMQSKAATLYKVHTVASCVRGTGLQINQKLVVQA